MPREGHGIGGVVICIQCLGSCKLLLDWQVVSAALKKSCPPILEDLTAIAAWRKGSRARPTPSRGVGGPKSPDPAPLVFLRGGGIEVPCGACDPARTITSTHELQSVGIERFGRVIHGRTTGD